MTEDGVEVGGAAPRDFEATGISIKMLPDGRGQLIFTAGEDKPDTTLTFQNTAAVSRTIKLLATVGMEMEKLR